MHEASLVTDLVRRVEQVVLGENARRATEVVVAQGRFGHLSADHLRGHFDVAAVGTLAEGAALRVDGDDDGDGLRLVSVTVEDD